MEIRPSTFLISTDFWGRRLNLFVLEGGGELLLVDTGVAGMPGEVILPYLHERGLSGSDVSWVANTHAHADHMGGNAEIKEAYAGARLGAHEYDAPWIEDHALHCREFYEQWPDLGFFDETSRVQMLELCGQNVSVDVRWKGGEDLNLGGRRIDVIHAPGHSRGHILLLDREARLVVIGDAVLGGAEGEPGKLPIGDYYDVAAYRCTLRRLAELPWDLLLSSHEEPKDRESGLRFIQESLGFIDRFDEQVHEVLGAQREPVPLAAILNALSDRFGYQPNLGLVRLIETHLIHGTRTGRLKELPGGRWRAV